MRISSVNHPYDFQDGLRKLTLRELRRIVVLAGPNGSGKTRLLRRVLPLHRTSWPDYQDSAKNEVRRQWLKEQPAGEDGRTVLSSRSFVMPPSGSTTPTEVQPLLFGVAILPAEGESPREHLRVLPLNVRPAELEDPVGTGSWGIHLQAADPSSGDLAEACIPYIRHLQEQHSEAGLAEIVGEFLGTALQVDGAHPRLFGQPIASSTLSEGQQILLQWAVRLHALDPQWDGDIYTLDEPENYLHPKALVQVLDRLLKKNEHGQFWIATHSLSLAAWLFAHHRDELSLYFMSGGEAHSLQREPERWEEMSDSLLGGPGHIGPLREFLDYPGALAATLFAAQCLFPSPPISAGRKGDPQSNVVYRSLPEKQEGRLKVIDFGAGDGRLLDCLLQDHGPEHLRERLDYYAADLNLSAVCRGRIAEIYPDHASRFVTDLNILCQSHHLGTFDVCVMCNVLHEIDPSQWLSLFAAVGPLRQLLHPEGMLILVEDYQMPKGEHSHRYGFIVLETLAVKALFGEKKAPQTIAVCASDDPHYSGRIKAHAIPVPLLGKVKRKSRKKALKVSERFAKEKINEMRGQPAEGLSFVQGQRLALWVQQLANVRLALDDLG